MREVRFFNRSVNVTITKHGFSVPGPVTDLSGMPTQNSLEITWKAPEEPNGIIIGYEVTYRINNSNIIVVNTTGTETAFTIPSLTPGTRISNISVSAYTGVGRGQPAFLDDLTTLDGICKEHNKLCVQLHNER